MEGLIYSKVYLSFRDKYPILGGLKCQKRFSTTTPININKYKMTTKANRYNTYLTAFKSFANSSILSILQKSPRTWRGL